MKISINQALCIGCGLCAAAVPEVFSMAGQVSSVAAQPEKAREGRVFDAANACPVNAIAIAR